MRFENLAQYLFLAFCVMSVAGAGISKRLEKRTEYTEAAQMEVTQEETKKVALTFDDGPHPVNTPDLLDGLEERGVKATFFLIGAHIEGNEAIVKRMYDDGHLLGNHTYDHVQINTLNDADACEQLIKTNDLISSITGEDTSYIRPPFGAVKEGLDCGIPMMLVKWTVDPRDWTTKNVSQIVNNVVTEVQENDIILLHDYYGSSVEAALQIIDILQAEGFEFVTVEELMMD